MKQQIISTGELAAQIGLSPSTILSNLSRYGHVFGVKPVAKIGGKLRWPVNSAEQITALNVYQRSFQKGDAPV